MCWYSASVVIYVKFKDGIQDHYPIWENVVLISAKSDDDAMAEACLIGQESDGDEFTWEEREACWVFAGVRKLLSIDVPSNLNLESGTEVTYSQMLLKTREDLEALIDGEEVELIYEK